MRKGYLLNSIVISFIKMIVVSAYIVFISVANQNLNIQSLVHDFISRAEFEEEITVYFPNGTKEVRRYYRITPIKDYELFEQRSIFYETKNDPFLGQAGDIFVTQESPFPETPVVHEMMTFFVGGHAALNNGENRLIEAVGFPQPNESIMDIIKDKSIGDHSFTVGVKVSSSNYWFQPDYRSSNEVGFSRYGNYYRQKFLILRVKYADQEMIDETLSYANHHAQNRSLYNFLFVFDTKNKFYCTDLISRSYRSGYHQSEGVYNRRFLNDNGFVTTVNDLILSRDTYIAAYIINENGIRNIYYLDYINA